MVKRAQRDPQAFEQIYDTFSPEIYKHFLFHTNHDVEASQDMTQDTFLKAFDHIKEYKDQGFKYKTYLYTIAHNTLVN